MTLKSILPILVLFFSMTGCAYLTAGSGPSSEAADHHSSRISIDWTGAYQGTTPCADCPGIETTVLLFKDENYLWLSHYLDKGNNLFVEKGKFEWNKDGNTLSLTSRNNKKRPIRVGENQIFMLDHNGKRIRGELADFYTLKKISFEQSPEAEYLLKDKEWVLSQFINDSIGLPDTAKQRPTINFNTPKKRISGFGGCNRFFGEYSIQKDSTIRFSEMGATKMYCIDAMEIEDHFFDVLRKCRYLKVSKTLLILEDKNHNKMAVFYRNRSVEQ